MEVMGLESEIEGAPTEDDVQPPEYEIWPENEEAFWLFDELQTQWYRVMSPDGELIRTGLNYQSIDTILARTNGIPRRRWNKLHEQMRFMERVALREMWKALEARQLKRKDEFEKNRNESELE